MDKTGANQIIKRRKEVLLSNYRLYNTEGSKQDSNKRNYILQSSTYSETI